jgi:S1-C subfamily serine protease
VAFAGGGVVAAAAVAAILVTMAWPETTGRPAPVTQHMVPTRPAAETGPRAAVAPKPAEPATLGDAAPPAEPADLDMLSAPPTLSIEDVVTRSMPAVVTVETGTGTGSGFFVANDTVLTNAHVVQHHEVVTLRWSGGATKLARVENKSHQIDLAVLKVQIVAPDQIYLGMAGPADVRIGGEVIAIGSPLGLQNTVTRGIVSGMRDVGGIQLIQTDAAINPGNSGGPLLDRQGRVLGINTLKLGGLAEGIGFAVSVHYARPYLGADFAPKSARELMREDGLRQYESHLQTLAQRADSIEKNWRGYRSSCFVNAESDAARPREWFALADGSAGLTHDVPRCASWAAYFKDWAKKIREGLRRSEEAAAAAGVSAQQTRRVRQKYGMVWADWEP